VYGDPVVEATQKVVDKLLTKPSQKPLADSIMDEAKSDWGRSLSLREWKHELENINKQEYSFYNKVPEAQRASLGNIQSAVRKAQRDAIADTLYRSLSPEDGGAGPKAIQSQIGDMLDIKDAATNRRRAIRREEPVSNLETTRRVVNTGLHVTAMPLRAVFSNEALKSPEEGVMGKSNPLIRRSFGAVREKADPYPTPASKQHPWASGGAPPGAAFNSPNPLQQILALLPHP
jgi:hypothetical protein